MVGRGHAANLATGIRADAPPVVHVPATIRLLGRHRRLGSMTAMEPGTRVEVRSRFDRRWSRGFEIDSVLAAEDPEPQYRIRRRSDNSVLPVEFPADDLREEKRHRSLWWVS